MVALTVAGTAAEPACAWRQTEGALGLERGGRVLWQLNFKKEEGKPYFHPVALADGTVLTAPQPADHPWHRGLWWSWKLINGRNYWEEDKKTGLSEGRTELASVKAIPHRDSSARVEMELSYHLPDQPPVMTEKRVLNISAPDGKGNYFIDWESVFTAGAEELTLDRTPPKNRAGGYAGLSLRLAAGMRDWTFTSSEGAVGATNIYGANARWLDFSHGGGVTIFEHPANPRHPTWWYPNQGMPFFTPAFLFKEPYVLGASQVLRLRYRVFMHAEPLDKRGLEKQWKAFGKAKFKS